MPTISEERQAYQTAYYKIWSKTKGGKLSIKKGREKYVNSTHGKAVRKKYYLKHKVVIAQYVKVWKRQRKIEVLTKYSQGGNLCCSWPGCKIYDPDMLTLDHINDDGAAHRKKFGGGDKIYLMVKKLGFPKTLSLQTLCWNHQWKKRIGGNPCLG